MAERLRAVPALAGLRIEVLHGRLDPDVKDRTMRAFAAGEIDVLVSTTVIEVGVDVANASVMVVMDADRFGISQLHQLRGRVGRGGGAGTLSADDRGARGDVGPRAAGRGGVDDRRVRAGAARPPAAPRGRRPRCSAERAGARRCGSCGWGTARDAQIIAEAREDATAVVDVDPTLADHPDLAARVAARLDEEQAAYLERG